MLVFDIQNADVTMGLLEGFGWQNMADYPPELDQPELFMVSDF